MTNVPRAVLWLESVKCDYCISLQAVALRPLLQKVEGIQPLTAHSLPSQTRAVPLTPDFLVLPSDECTISFVNFFTHNRQVHLDTESKIVSVCSHVCDGFL